MRFYHSIAALLAGAGLLLPLSKVAAQSQLRTRWADQVDRSNPLPEYPRPNLVRKQWQNLNGSWDYAVTRTDVQPARYDGKILVPFPLESQLSGVERQLQPDEWLWYRRTFVTKAHRTERTLLHFGAVDWQTKVWVNGHQAGGHTGGYTAFDLDITAYLKAGKNELLVRVYDPTDRGYQPRGKQVLQPGNIYYTGSSGIWQTVWLEQVPWHHVRKLITTPDVDQGVIRILPEIADNDRTGVKLVATVDDGTREISSLSVKAGEPLVLPIPHVRLWNPDTPFLYHLVVQLKRNGRVEDRVTSYFGMRKVSIGKDAAGHDRIMLNNHYTYNLGTLDQGFWPDGLYTAPTDSALRFDILAAKAMGFNMIRKHIKVEPARWYYQADRLGILVWQDLVNPNPMLPDSSKMEFERESAEILAQLHNYPSITTWVLFNEKWGRYDQERLTRWIKQTDPSRLVNGHSGEYLYVNRKLRSPSPNAYIGADLTDVHSYPMPMLPVHQAGKAMVLGEFGGIGVPVEGHLWDDLVAGWGYDGIANPAKLRRQYGQMTDSLVQLEKEGLSASVYTQPFDVESEQNGLITYDRKIAKLPLDTIRQINGRLWPATAGSGKIAGLYNLAVAPAVVPDYGETLHAWHSGSHDSASLRRLVIMAIQRKDSAVMREAGRAYWQQLRNLNSAVNLRLIAQLLNEGDSSVFDYCLAHVAKMPAGPRAEIEDKLLSIIHKRCIIPVWERVKKDKPHHVNWDSLERAATMAYGILGREKVLEVRMVAYYSSPPQDWARFSQAYRVFFSQFNYRARDFVGYMAVNNLADAVFNHVNDPETLRLAIASMHDVLRFSPQDANFLDTYANLLYKVGRKQEAMLQEARALSYAPREPTIQQNMTLMKKGEKTWDR